jgi:hypothetical protein
MKNKERPSIGSALGNPSPPEDRHIPGRASAETTGSTVRQDGAASASIEKPASRESFERQRQWPAVLPTPLPLTCHQSTQVCVQSLSSRRMRARMHGGMGAGKGDRPGYSILLRFTQSRPARPHRTSASHLHSLRWI